MTIVPAVALFALGGCGGGDNDAAATRDTQAWKLVLEIEGSTHEFPLERMDIFLAAEDWPEIFEIRGDGVTLVGEFPRDVRVDYEEALDNLIDQPITISPHGGDPRDEKRSAVVLDGIDVAVTGGTFTVERTSGSLEGSEGDRTIHGTIELRVRDTLGERTLRGRFATHAVTWG